MQDTTTIAHFKAIIEEQMELLRLCLFIASQGPATLDKETLVCTLKDKQRRASTLIAMAAGQSLSTILKMADLRGIPARDIYPVARSTIESFVNAAFIATEGDDVADRAINYVAYASWRETNRTIGSGEFMIKLQSDPEVKASPFPEFNGRGNDSWTKLDLPSRIRRVGENAGRKAGSRLLGAYGVIYSISSEIIHGTPYGVSYFYNAHQPKNPDADDFKNSTRIQIEFVLLSVISATAG